MNREKMEGLPCEVVQDLLPLYVDGVVNETTVKMVEEHLNQCESCKEEYAGYREEVSMHVAKTGNERFAEFKQKIDKRHKKKTIVASVLSCVILLVFIYVLMEVPFVPVSEKKMEVEDVYVFQTEEDVKIVLRYKMPCYDGPTQGKVTATEKDNRFILNTNMKRTAITGIYSDEGETDFELVSVDSMPESITFADEIIWNRAKNADEEIPDYVKEYVRMNDGEPNDINEMTMDDEGIGFDYTDGRRIFWDWDGTVTLDTDLAYLSYDYDFKVEDDNPVQISWNGQGVEKEEIYMVTLFNIEQKSIKSITNQFIEGEVIEVTDGGRYVINVVTKDGKTVDLEGCIRYEQ